MAEPEVPPAYVAHVRRVTAELRELIPTVASVAGHARALFDVDMCGAGANGRVLALSGAAAGVTDLADVAELLRALLDLSEPLADEVMVDLMHHLDRHARR